MPFWTLQSKKVVDIAKKEGVYSPDFSLSPKQHQDDYQRILSAYNSQNRTACKGLIFCLAPEIFTHGDNEFKSVDEIKALFQGNSMITDSFRGVPYNLFDENHVLMKLDRAIYGEINVIALDYWNLILTMDGGSPDTFETLKRNSCYFEIDYTTFEKIIFESIKQGQYVRPINSTTRLEPYNTMTEIHIPNIPSDAILETYEASDLLA